MIIAREFSRSNRPPRGRQGAGRVVLRRPTTRQAFGQGRIDGDSPGQGNYLICALLIPAQAACVGRCRSDGCLSDATSLKDLNDQHHESDDQQHVY